jgi:hypothetical protein
MEIIDVSDTLPWNENGQRWKVRKLEQIKRIVVHQSLGTKTVKDTNHFCITNSPNIALGRGMPKIAYHWFIEPDGKIYRCNKETDVTSHVKNMNTSSLAIVLGGFYNYDKVKTRDGDPSAIQLKSLEWLISHLQSMLKLTNNDVYTHDELQGKPSCPGRAAAALIKKLRTKL